jgi:hypothetical protein
MLQKTLLATTALVLCVSSMAFTGEISGPAGDKVSLRNGKLEIPTLLGHRLPAIVRPGKVGLPVPNNVSHWVAGATFNNFSKDKNAEFVSWYGFPILHTVSSCGSSCQISDFGTWAVPIVGAGKEVKRITVPLFSETGSTTEYNAGIYSATASGLPGKQELAGASTTASDTEYCCTSARTVDIDIRLKKGDKYFLEVMCPVSCYGGWQIEDTDFSGDAFAYYQFRERYKDGTYHYTASSPWTVPSTIGPNEPAGIIK